MARSVWVPLLCLAALVAMEGQPFAECLKDPLGQVVCGRGRCIADVRGRVFCARSRYGAVVTTVNGVVLCGKGDCVSTMKGQWYCSTAEDGSVYKDWDGSIRCEDSCEPASVANCEATPAGR